MTLGKALRKALRKKNKNGKIPLSQEIRRLLIYRACLVKLIKKPKNDRY
jgi:hypothetical protein